MGRVLTNNVGLSYVAETALGTADTSGWKQLEPNDISAFGAEITTVARSPISQNRQRRKGTVTDLDSSVEFEVDLTMSSFRDFIEGFVFAVGVNSDVVQLAATGAETTGDTYTGLTALTAGQANKFEDGTLIWASGFSNSANNGLKQVDADIATSATAISVAENLVDESGATGRVSFAGLRIASGDSPTWDWDGTAKLATLANTGTGTLAAALGLTVGQMVHIGSVASLGGAIQNAFQNSAANDMYGYARVVSIAADAIVFDKVDARLQFDDSTAPATAVDVLFGEFVRNVPVSNASYLERSFHFEAAMPNLGDGTAGNTDDAYQYAKGNLCNEASFELPLTNKATVSFGFIGTDTDNPTTSRKTGASSAEAPTQTAALNTSSDIARLRIQEVDEDGITTDFKSLTLTLGNNVSPDKVLGTLGAAYMNTGNFEVGLEAELLFTNPLVVNKIRDNETVTMDFVVKNDDGVIAIDIPSMTLGGGSRSFPVNESVLISVTGEAFADPTLNTSIGVSTIHVPLP
jgi:hypothetical protein